MKILGIFISVIILSPAFSWASNRLLSSNVSAEQGVFRLELQFDKTISQEEVGIQFDGNQLVMRIPDAKMKKNLGALTSELDFIKEITSSATDKEINVAIELNDLKAIQLKENFSLESVGNSLILEILPPLWTKSANVETKADLNPPVVTAEGGPAKSLDAGDAIKKEDEIPLFVKKSGGSSSGSEAGKIIFMVLSVLAMGGGLIWWMKNQSKMVNGPESLMKIKMVTQFHLGPKKSLAVIRIAGESLLLGITDNDIRLIKTLSLLDEDLPEVANAPFNEVLSNESSSSSSAAMVAQEGADEGPINDEDFSFGPAVKTSFSQKIPLLRKLV